MEALKKLQLWMDPVARGGPEAMAVDEWLLENVKMPLLRIYRWDGDWASVGYFGKIAQARQAISRVRWVRRWTGGGTVDHRLAWTYTLVIPNVEKLARVRGGESYYGIHGALAEVFTGEGASVSLSEGQGETGAALCFENPVSHDLIGAGGEKLAGAGQRRTRNGLLHQGSAALACSPSESLQRGEKLATALSEFWTHCEPRLDKNAVVAKTTARYGNEKWLEQR